MRAQEFLPQLKKPRDPTRVAVGSGLALIGLGLVKKVVIADYLAREVVDPVFAVPQAYAAPDVWLAAYAYTAQIYCDFSGYTDMAIGLALLMGYVFPQNFRSPYRATGFRDFWRRWHMTLSRFLRDFLYIPLGGNRGGRAKTYRNLMITMVLGGLWHGAAWPFVLWGAFHGTGLVVEHALGGRVKHAGLVALARHLPPHRLRVDPVPLADRRARRHLPEPPHRAGPATLWTRARRARDRRGDRPAAPAGAAGRAAADADRETPAHGARHRASPSVVLFVGATVSSQGVAPFIYFRF